MRKSFKYRIYLTKGQHRILEQQLEECRWVYNETLVERKRAYEERGESLRLYDTQALLPVWKMTRPALKLVHSQVLQNISVRVDLAFQAFFRRVKEGAAEVGFPRFKGFGRYDSITYPQYGNGVRLEGERLMLSKLVGAVHVVLHRPVEGTPKTVTRTQDVSQLLIRARTTDAVGAAETQVRAVLRDRHGLHDGQPEDFSLQANRDMINAASGILGGLTAFLAMVGGIALLVGGIGIMNIMVVSVTQRTREIGLRRAVGAHQSDILNQFLIEAVVLSLTGGVLGILVGYGITTASAIAVLIFTGSALISGG